MNLLKRIFNNKQQKTTKRGFQAGESLRVLSTWIRGLTNFNSVLKQGAEAVRARARDAAINDPLAVSYLQLAKTNIVGPSGIKFDAQALNPDGTLDKNDSATLKTAFTDWQNACTLDGQSFIDALNLAVESVERDGEAFVQLLRGPFNKSGCAFQLINPDLLPMDYNQSSRGGNYIRSSIEYNSKGQVVAYHVLSADSRDPGSASRYDRIVLPAKDVIHLFYKSRVEQGRGYSSFAPVLTMMKQLSEYAETELVASRVGASTMGLITRPPGEEGMEPDENGDFMLEVSPGTFAELPPGYDLKTYDPSNPSSNFSAFVKTLQRSIASGLGVSYNALTGDLDSGSGTALRFGLIAERDNWKAKQSFFKRNFCERLYQEWLTTAMLRHPTVSKLPLFRAEKYQSADIWIPRAFPWIDPTKDVLSQKMLLDLKLVTRSELAQDQGRNFEEVVRKIAEENNLMDSLGIKVEDDKLAAQILQLQAQADAKQGN